MKTQDPLQLLEEYLRKNGTEKLDMLMSEFDGIEYEGPTLDEYFQNFHLEFDHYSNVVFSRCYTDINKVDITSKFDFVPVKNLFTCKEMVNLSSNKSIYNVADSGPDSFVSAA